jgi:hypothetical protein
LGAVKQSLRFQPLRVKNLDPYRSPGLAFAAFIQTPSRKSGQFVEPACAQSAIHRIGISSGPYFKEYDMRVMVFVKATKKSEAGLPPAHEMEKMFAEMGKFNEQLIKAGIMQSGDGLKPSKFGKRVTFKPDGKKSVVDGPFAETKELVAGYWVWNVKSMDEALEWVKRCPNPMPGEESDIEIRPFYEMEDFGAAATPELRDQYDKFRKEVERQQKA